MSQIFISTCIHCISLHKITLLKWQGCLRCLSSWRVGSLLEVPCTRVCSWFRSPRTGCQFSLGVTSQPNWHRFQNAAAQMRPLRAPKCGHPSDRWRFSLGGNSLQRWTTWNLEWKFHTSVCVHASQSIISIILLSMLYIYIYIYTDTCNYIYINDSAMQRWWILRDSLSFLTWTIPNVQHLKNLKCSENVDFALLKNMTKAEEWSPSACCFSSNSEG